MNLVRVKLFRRVNNNIDFLVTQVCLNDIRKISRQRY